MINLKTNKMKKLMFFLMMLVSLTTFSNTISTSEKNAIANNTKEMPAEVKVMLTRLEEIKTMDKSSLKSSERKALRKEVRAINTELRSTGNGIYISVGAIIIILLLIIIL
jgi:hypothetical protein